MYNGVYFPPPPGAGVVEVVDVEVVEAVVVVVAVASLCRKQES